jgi:hypothetical protein
MIKAIFSLIQRIFTSNPELVHLCADEWLGIYNKLFPQRESLKDGLQELLGIIEKQYFKLIQERLADGDGGPAVYGIIIPVCLHSNLNELRNN